MKTYTNLIQRTVYFALLLIFILSWIFNERHSLLFDRSSLGIEYVILDMGIITFLLIQAIFNLRVIWLLICVLWVVYFYLMVDKIIGKENYSQLLLVPFIAAIVIAFQIYMKPKLNRNLK